ncbi:MAG: hypothetical protein PVF37_17540, partial [Desulfobacterales bacterium]
MTLYLKDATYIDWQNFAINNSHLSVDEGPAGNILFIDTIPSAADLNSGDRVLNCAGKLVTKSFGCGHHHIYSTLARGMPAPAKVPTNFTQILQYIWWHIDKRL